MGETQAKAAELLEAANYHEYAGMACVHSHVTHDWYSESGNCKRMGCQQNKSHHSASVMARHILATVMADDDEPISEEWIQQCGWEHDGHTHKWYSCPESGLVWRYNSGLYIAGSPCTAVRKRGQLRNLCRVLGIQLPTTN